MFELSNNQTFKMFDKSVNGVCLMSGKVESLSHKKLPEFNISQVEELVSELKENLRLSAMTTKTRSYISRKSSRASPYRVPARCKCDSSCPDCDGKSRRSFGRNGSHHDEDPYELLQKLIQDGNLVTEAVRRINLTRDLPPKQRYFYESEEEIEATLVRRHNVSKDNSE